jgi:pyrimidine operon attenuation protein/uracil phosphoribosyltransferase
MLSDTVMEPKILLDSKEIKILLQRLACELIENHGDFTQSVLIGIQPRGILLLERMRNILANDYQISNLQTGVLDITFFRDDFRRRDGQLEANTTSINVLLENKRVILIDDVLFTGRSIRAALTAIEHYGRPSDIELMVLIDRRFSRNLPIQPTYKGKQVDAFNNEKIKVQWHEQGLEDLVMLRSGLCSKQWQ